MIETELLTLGNDQLGHMHELVFPSGIPSGDKADLIALRADQTFDPPEELASTYEFSRHGKKIVKTSTFEETAKEITFEVRLDQQWAVYDDLKTWIDNVLRIKQDIPLADLRTKIQLDAMDEDKNVIKSIIYIGAVLKGLKIGSFDTNSGDPIRLTLTFAYLEIE